MKKNIVLAVLAVLALCIGQVQAAEYDSNEPVNFTVSANVPMAGGVSISAIKVNAADDAWGAEVTDLDFNLADGELDFDSENGIWTSDHYFAINVGLVGGAGSLTTTVKYADGATPTGQTKGLGYKATAKFVKVFMGTSGEAESDLTAGTQLLKDMIGTGVTVSQADVSGGYLRVYVGMYDGASTDLNDAGGEPFTNADRPGVYNGTLTITAVVS